MYSIGLYIKVCSNCSALLLLRFYYYLFMFEFRSRGADGQAGRQVEGNREGDDEPPFVNSLKFPPPQPQQLEHTARPVAVTTARRRSTGYV